MISLVQNLFELNIKIVKNTLFVTIGFLSFFSLSTRSYASEKNSTTITIDQKASTVTIIEKSGRSILFPAITGIKSRLLDEGRYKVKFISACIKNSDGFCLPGADGLYQPKPSEVYSTLAAWGSPNKATALPIYLEPVSLVKRHNTQVTGVRDGVTPIPALHSAILKKLPNGEFEIPPEVIKSGKASQGCIRLGWYNLRYLYTLFLLAMEQGETVDIYVK